MKLRIVIFLGLLISFDFAVGKTPSDPKNKNCSDETCLCEKFKSGLGQLKKAHVSNDVEARFTALPSPAERFDSAWFYFDVGDFVLPVPEKPKIFQRDGETIVIRSPKFTAVVGGDVLKGSLAPLQKYVEANGIKSDYDFNSHLYSEDFTKCTNIKTQVDLDSKLKLATIKSLSAPFVIDKILHFDGVRAIVLAGPKKGNDKILATNLFVRKSADETWNAMIFFESADQQKKFHSYISRIREKGFFASGHPLKL
ncbi:MAG: hypothetical protein AB7F86_04790 [Bdellovibrionales bacterium]